MTEILPKNLQNAPSSLLVKKTFLTVNSLKKKWPPPVSGTDPGSFGQIGSDPVSPPWRTHPVHLHDLKPLRDVGRVGRQPRASGDEAHEEDSLLVGELLQGLPEPLHQRVLLVHLSVAHHLLQHVAADLRHPAHHLLQLLGRQQREQRHRDDPRHALTHRRHLRDEHRRRGEDSCRTHVDASVWLKLQRAQLCWNELQSLR